MDLEEVINRRKSIRKFENKEISKEIIYKIIELANLSPSAGNLQARSIIIVENKEVKKELAKICFGQNFLESASIVLIIFANLEESAKRYGERGRELYAIQDATIFASYIQLLAKNYGLDSCWVGAFDENKLKKFLGLTNNNLRPIAIIPIGYSSEEKERPPRKNLKNIIIKEI